MPMSSVQTPLSQPPPLFSPIKMVEIGTSILTYDSYYFLLPICQLNHGWITLTYIVKAIYGVMNIQLQILYAYCKVEQYKCMSRDTKRGKRQYKRM